MSSPPAAQGLPHMPPVQTSDPPSPEVRRDKLIHGWREPVTPRPAATVLLLRDHAGRLEVLMTRRSLRASFAPGAFVFPGGVVDAADALAVGCDPALLEEATARESAGEHREALHRIYAQAALREAWEEVGMLLACRLEDAHRVRLAQSTPSTPSAGSPRAVGPIPASKPAAGASLDPVIAQLARRPVEGFASALARHGLRADLERVRSFSHWTTDRDLPKRFDVRFLVAYAPEGQVPVADEGEQFEPCWVHPAEALERHAQGSFALIFPTIRTLRQLASLQTVQAAMEHAEGEFAAGRLWRSCPRGGLVNGEDTRFTEDEPPFAELAMTHPDGRVLHPLHWQHEHPVGLLTYLQRLTAPNPGRMTGPGTNTYLLGAPGRWIVVDPGPAIAAHVERIRQLTQDRIVCILCTHSHLDHAPAAFALQAAIADQGGARIPILGRPSGATIDTAQHFMPDRILEDGERIQILPDTHLRVIHTPGHASNHLCFLIEEDGLLLSGDHIMQGSTVVINPPDGDMRAYLDSLADLASLPLRYILPAHGYVLGHPAQAISALINHRLQREAKVVRALQELHSDQERASLAVRTMQPAECASRPLAEAEAAYQAGTEAGFSVEAIVPRAYAEVAATLYPLAARSLLAHLIKLEGDGAVRRVGAGWRLDTGARRAVHPS